jgi:hypothetical protein
LAPAANRCEACDGMRTSPAITKITHKNKACALRENPNP